MYNKNFINEKNLAQGRKMGDGEGRSNDDLC